MKPYQERILIEKQELDKKISEITNFISSETFSTLPILGRNKLTDQLAAMTVYSEILKDRITGFNQQFNLDTVEKVDSVDR